MITSKRLLALTAFLCFLMNVYGQEHATNKRIIIYVTRSDEARMNLQRFLNQYNAVIYKTDQDVYEYDCEFRISMDHVQALDSLSNKLGYILQSTFNTENYAEKIATCKSRINSLNEQNKRLYEQLKDTVLYNEQDKDRIKEKIISNDYSITENQNYISQYEENQSENNTCYVSLSLRDEMSTPNNSRVSFVNMPGFEYNYLWIENPKAGLSSTAYQGFAIKYMFTRGKSYFNLGVYKSVKNNVSDTTLINELFMINFGQDFYPKHFGRGARRFLNLYTGYQVGGFITNRNNEKNSAFVPNANLSLGLELFKTKHILIDNKVTYFLPLNDMNHNMRGIIYSASFNFVF